MLEITIKTDSPEAQKKLSRFIGKLYKDSGSKGKIQVFGLSEGEEAKIKQKRKYRKRGAYPLGFPPAWEKCAAAIAKEQKAFSFKDLNIKGTTQQIEKQAFMSWFTKNYAYKAEKCLGQNRRGWLFSPVRKRGKKAC